MLWLRTLHIFFAGLFAFVLPLICYGAQATPGHPHARAHFIFLPPPLSANVALATSTAELPAGAVDHSAHSTTEHAAAEAAERPVGRSIPAMLGFALLLLISLVGSLLLHRMDRPKFVGWLASPTAISIIPAIPTPPPRSFFPL